MSYAVEIWIEKTVVDDLLDAVSSIFFETCDIFEDMMECLGEAKKCVNQKVLQHIYEDEGDSWLFAGEFVLNRWICPLKSMYSKKDFSKCFLDNILFNNEKSCGELLAAIYTRLRIFRSWGCKEENIMLIRDIVTRSYRTPECFFTLTFAEYLNEEDFKDIPVKFDMHFIKPFKRYFAGDSDVDLEYHFNTSFNVERKLPIAQLVDHGILPFLVQLIGGPHQYNALSFLLKIAEEDITLIDEETRAKVLLIFMKGAESPNDNLAVGGVTLAASICYHRKFKEELGPWIIKLLKSPRPKIIETALWSIRRLVRKESSLAFHFLELDLIPSLLKLTNPELDETLSHDLLYTWETLFQNKELTNIIFDKVFPNLLKFIYHPDLGIATHTLQTIDEIANGTQADKLIDAGIIEILKPFLKSTNYNFLPVLMLQHLLVHASEDKKPILDLEILKSIKILINSEIQGLPYMALWCLMAHTHTRESQKTSEELLEADLLPSFFKLLEHRDLEVARLSFALITLMVKNGTNDQIDQMLEMNIICPYAAYARRMMKLKYHEDFITQFTTTTYEELIKNAKDEEFVKVEFKKCGDFSVTTTRKIDLEGLSSEEKKQILSKELEVEMNNLWREEL